MDAFERYKNAVMAHALWQIDGAKVSAELQEAESAIRAITNMTVAPRKVPHIDLSHDVGNIDPKRDIHSGVRERVLAVLASEPDREFTPLELLEKMPGAKVENIRSKCSILFGEGKIGKPSFGKYRALREAVS
jgi:hypothetical protein